MAIIICKYNKFFLNDLAFSFLRMQFIQHGFIWNSYIIKLKEKCTVISRRKQYLTMQTRSSIKHDSEIKHSSNV